MSQLPLNNHEEEHHKLFEVSPEKMLSFNLDGNPFEMREIQCPACKDWKCFCKWIPVATMEFLTTRFGIRCPKCHIILDIAYQVKIKIRPEKEKKQ